MSNLIKILVVEDEMLIGANISMQLTSLGYDVTGIIPFGEEALRNIKDNKPDIVLLDIHLKGRLDGIETAAEIHKIDNIPIIYLTANADEATFNRAKETRPTAFISKPFKQLDLQRAIELTICSLAEDGFSRQDKSETGLEPVILKDRIFIRYQGKMIKIMTSDILYIEADRNYSRIFTPAKEYLISTTLKTIEDKFSGQLFARIHRSFIVNMVHINEVAEDHVIIAEKAIPLSAGMKEQLRERIQTL